MRRKNERKNSKPWILPWLENAIQRKQKSYHDFIKNNSKTNKTTYSKLKNFCKKHVNLAKKKYYKKFFDEHKENSKKQWEMINSLLNRKSKKSTNIKLHNESGDVFNTPKDVATEFNKYFASIASDLKTKISTRQTFDPGGFKQFLTNPSNNSMYVKPVDSSEIFEII